MAARHRLWLLPLGGTLLLGANPFKELPKGAMILPPSKGALLLHQCSRATPARPDGYWAPGAADIFALESALPDALDRNRATMKPVWNRILSTHRRQYTGLVRAGRRYIYGSFYPDNVDRPGPDQVMVACDGGPNYFGVEFDLARHAFTQIAFNGEA